MKKQKVSLKYGTGKISFDLPDDSKIFRIIEPEKKVTASQFASKLRYELKRLKPDFTSVAVVLSDKTRLCDYPKFLPVLLNTLESFVSAPDRITIYIAYGSHFRQTDEECIAVYGESYKNYRFIHHDCNDAKSFKKLGKTIRGTPVYVRNDILDAGFLITFGAISHHYFAGYGGGRKLIFPGLGYKKAIYHNHGLFLDAKRQTLSPYCQSGMLDKNPLAEDLAEIETYRPADLAIHGILDSQGNVCDLLIGSGTDHFFKACEMHGKNCEISTDLRYDLVIASCGGSPKDINFIQSHKAIDNAAKFVRAGGSLIIMAECPDGVGSKTFLPWFEIGDWNKAFSKLVENYKGNGGAALSMMSKVRRIKILMVTDLSDSLSKTIGVEKISIDKAKMFLKQSTGPLAVLPNASLLTLISHGKF